MRSCQKSPLAQNQIRVQELSAVIPGCRGTIWCSEASPWYFKLERFSYIAMTPQCTLVACDCSGVTSHPRFMFDSCSPLLKHRHTNNFGRHTGSPTATGCCPSQSVMISWKPTRLCSICAAWQNFIGHQGKGKRDMPGLFFLTLHLPRFKYNHDHWYMTQKTKQAVTHSRLAGWGGPHNGVSSCSYSVQQHVLW